MAYKSKIVDNGGTTTGYDPTLTVPADTLLGDRMTVMVFTTDNNPSIAPTPPATETWTLEASGSMPIDGTAATSPVAVWIYGKDASQDDEDNAGSKTYTWTFSGAEEQIGILYSFDPSTFGQFAKNEVTGTHTSIDAPSVTTTVTNEEVFHCAIKDGGALFTAIPATNFNEERTSTATTGAEGVIAVSYGSFASPGATGTKTFTHATEESNGFTFSMVETGVPTLEQEGFRWRDDDDDEANASWAQAQDGDDTITSGDTTRLRILTDASGDPGSQAMKLQYKRSGDADSEYRDIV